MQQHIPVARQFGMHDEAQIGQVDAARGDIGRDADLRAAVAQRLQRAVPLRLGQFAGQRHGAEAALRQVAMQARDGGAGGAEDDGAFIVPAQHIDQRVLHLSRRGQHGVVGDVAMHATLTCRGDAERVALVALGEGRDLRRDGGGEQQGTTGVRRDVQDGFQLVPEAHVEHLIGLIQHGDGQRREHEAAALDMVAQPPRRADDDMCAHIERAAFRAHVGTADAGHHPRPRTGIEPGEFGLHLQGKFARRRDHQGQRRPRRAEPRGIPQQVGHDGKPEGDRLARAGLRRDQQVAPGRLRRQHGFLDGGRLGIALGLTGRGDRGGLGREGQRGRLSEQGAADGLRAFRRLRKR